MDFKNLKDINYATQEQASSEVDKTKRELADLRTQEVFVKSIQSLAKFIEGHTTKSVVMNQLKDYATSDDMESLGKFLRDILEETKKHENTNVTPVVEALNEAVTELKAIPKEQLDISFPEQKDYSEAFKQLLQATKENLEATKAQKLEVKVQAPVVNVDAPIVNVDAPDLEPLGKDLEKSFLKAVKSIVIPTPESYKKVLADQLAEQKRTNKILEELPTGGSSGSTSIAPFLNSNNELPVSTSPLSSYLIADEEETATYSYTGFESANGGWCIQRETLASGAYRYAAGTSNYSTAWTNRASQTYQYPSQVF